MENKPAVRVGMVGYKFMGKAHSNAYRKVSMFFDPAREIRMRAICGRDEEWVRQAADKFGWEGYETDWKKLVRRDDIDLIDITTPSNFHKEIAIAAAENGKAVFCEKPLALNLEDAREILAAVRKAGVKHQIGFNYRFAPAIRLAKQMIDEGRLGKIFHFRGMYLQDFIIDPDFPRVWRLEKKIAGSGSLGDLGAHVIDLARYLVGDLAQVIGHSRTFIKERPLVERMTGLTGVADAAAPKGAVDVDDATLFIGEFENGALCTIEATRFAQGHKNDLSFEINGEKGSLRFFLPRINELEFFDATADAGLQGFSVIQVSEAIHPYWEHWWPAAHVIGYEHTFVHEMYEFIQSIALDTPASPDFEDGMKCSQVMEAVERSIAERRWIRLDEV
ncbi:MAG: Gfo/Idh/MocA family oxidoreductase [Clostridia bacterium]|nr:Gfo/Idh/MocA family oxidoreductase [Clostridia bacterium]